MNQFQSALFCTMIMLHLTGPVAAPAQEASVPPSREVQNLKAFTKLYGYVRFFHPSDEAQQVDWDKFAAYGARRVRQVADEQQLREILSELFTPLVPTLELYAGAIRQAPGQRPAAADFTNEDIVAWQHVGVGLAGNYLYKSSRTNRQTKVATGAGGGFGNVMQSVDAQPVQGQQIRLKFKARMAEGSGHLQGWLRVDRSDQAMGFFDNMQDRVITATEWKEYEIVGDVSDDAVRAAFGIFLIGMGSGLVDDVSLASQSGDGDWQPIEIKNADFEQGVFSPNGWTTRGDGFKFAFEKEDPSHGKKAMRISRKTAALGRLFPQTPAPGEFVDKPLAANLRCRFPLTLPADERYEAGSSGALDDLVTAVRQIDVADLSQAELCVTDIVIAWNIFQHFYPYFDQVQTDWQAALDQALEMAIAAQSKADTYHAVARMVAQLHDGHGFVMHPGYAAQRGWLPISLDWIEDQLVVIASDDERIKPGDVITATDGRPALEAIEQAEMYLAGSPQFRRYRAMQSVTRGTDGSAVELSLKRNGQPFTVSLVFAKDRQPSRPTQRDNIEQLSDGVYYVNLNGTSAEEIRPRIDELAEARAVIFDLRGYPNGTHFLLQHMTDQQITSQQWLVPQRIYPDQERLVDYQRGGRWVMPPLKPRFEGQLFFLTNASAISYAESVLSIVANYQLAEIVGQPTAGANGNVNPFTLPDGTSIRWTGMRVINHDDSQHHVLGVRPTIPVTPTIAAIRAGRDEYVECALELVNES